MAAARAFARCSECGHAAVMRLAAGGSGPARAACGLCGGPASEEPAPAELFSSWRCDCYHCTSTPC